MHLTLQWLSIASEKVIALFQKENVSHPARFRSYYCLYLNLRLVLQLIHS
jgi:hypothetical protein